MKIQSIKIERNGPFLNAWYEDQWFMVCMVGETYIQAHKRLISRVIKYHNNAKQDQ